MRERLVGTLAPFMLFVFFLSTEAFGVDGCGK